MAGMPHANHNPPAAINLPSPPPIQPNANITKQMANKVTPTAAWLARILSDGSVKETLNKKPTTIASGILLGILSVVASFTAANAIEKLKTRRGINCSIMPPPTNVTTRSNQKGQYYATIITKSKKRAKMKTAHGRTVGGHSHISSPAKPNSGGGRGRGRCKFRSCE